MNKLNPSIKHHIYIGIFISLWIFGFIFYIKPFDGGGDDLYWWWIYLSVGFSFIAFTTYFFVAIWQNYVYQKFLNWNISFEIFFITLFILLYLILTFLYYKSPFIRGIMSFKVYKSAYLKSTLLFIPVLIFLRAFVLRFLPKEVSKHEKEIEDTSVIIKGDYKLDVLRVLKSNLICISKSQNYIEVFYIENAEVKSKLIRSSLKSAHQDLNFLVQVHRSHLINPIHFRSWKNSNTIVLNQIEIPVSKNYKSNILSL